MLVSIIIPVYNVAPYVDQCIRSVMNQTMTEGVECIIVDDCGQDNSMEIVERVLAKEGYTVTEDGTLTSNLSSLTFRILHHEHNRGLSAARNTGIDAAKGEYVYFLDSDDWIVPECIALMAESVRKHPDSQIVFAGAEVTNGKHKWLDYTKKTLPEFSNNRNWLQLSMLRRYDFGMTAWNKLISRAFILKNNLYFEEGLIFEDELWNFIASKFIHAASFLNKNTYIYNIRSNSITANATEENQWRILFDLWDIMMSKIEGDRIQLQIRAITQYILDETKGNFPRKHKLSLAVLFWKLATRSSGRLSVLLFLQGVISLCLPSKYDNAKIRTRIGL